MVNAKRVLLRLPMLTSQPNLPPAHQRLAWAGFSLVVPEAWNLTLQQGDIRQGVIALADLRQVRLELRWNTHRPGRVARQYARLVARLRKRHRDAGSMPHQLPATRIAADGPVMVLLQGPTRLYELTFPEATGTPVEGVVGSFRDHTAEDAWPWQLYGVVGTVPARFGLRKAALFPGNIRLEFVGPRFSAERVTLGAWSLADRLLAGRPLAEWARANIPLLKHNPGADLATPGAHTARFTLALRTPLLRRPRHHALTLTHDPAANTIRWEERVSSRALPLAGATG